MSDAAHNRTVDGTRTGIQQRVKLECEREQQEQLLLSVIPAYIAAEVCMGGVVDGVVVDGGGGGGKCIHTRTSASQRRHTHTHTHNDANISH